MICHTEPGATPYTRLRALVPLLKGCILTPGSNCSGKIYGRLDCRAGKRMKPRNRVFFRDEVEAAEQGYRPCAVCMAAKYKAWKATRSLRLPL